MIGKNCGHVGSRNPESCVFCLTDEIEQLTGVLENIVATYTLGGTAEELSDIAYNRIHGLPTKDKDNAN